VNSFFLKAGFAAPESTAHAQPRRRAP